MPTTHVEATSADLLQGVADILGKSRKVVVVTGAGISTNSGIPDFRSKNGLYSLIQARLDATFNTSGTGSDTQCSEPIPSQYQEGPPVKRRRLDKVEDFIIAAQALSTTELATAHAAPSIGAAETSVLVPSSPSKAATDSVSSSTPTNSSDPETPATVHTLSSPLSSPPPVLFDPYNDSSSPCMRTASRRHGVSSTSSATSSRPDPLSSRSTLPNLKGRDLFDASIWADPIKTSVFYTFATELRRKTQDAEPTASHRFISQLRDSGKLVRCYTQNIDEIEEKVGLTTGLDLGPGSKGRFSLRGGNRPSVKTETSTTENSTPTDTTSGADDKQPEKDSKPPPKRDPGVECVYLHGSLNALRCFTCGQNSDWDESREDKTLSGLQPRCPHCEAATAARQERGKRALGIGKLRPDIVLYGEEHPKAHLISPIVQHDLALCPDMMIILGTSLRVHGLKVLVREFAKTIHNRGGKVVFVNLTKPSESVWSDIIDYWVQWDCDAWVQDLKERKPSGKKPVKKRRTVGRESTTASQALTEEASQISVVMDDKPLQAQPQVEQAPKPLPAVKGEISKPVLKKAAAKVKKSVYKPNAKNPMATRNCRLNGAYLVHKMMEDLAQFAGRTRPSFGIASAQSTPAKPMEIKRKPQRKPTRKSAPAALWAEGDSRPIHACGDGTRVHWLQMPARRRKSSIMPVMDTCQLPDYGFLPPLRTPPSAQTIKAIPYPTLDQPTQTIKATSSPLPAQPVTSNVENSILAAVKDNPRKRKRKTFGDEEVSLPKATSRGSSTEIKRANALPSIKTWALSSVDEENLTKCPMPDQPRLPPLRSEIPTKWLERSRPEPVHVNARMEPMSKSPLESPVARKMLAPFSLCDPLVNVPYESPSWSYKRDVVNRGRVETYPKSDWSPSNQLWSEALTGQECNED